LVPVLSEKYHLSINERLKDALVLSADHSAYTPQADSVAMPHYSSNATFGQLTSHSSESILSMNRDGIGETTDAGSNEMTRESSRPKTMGADGVNVTSPENERPQEYWRMKSGQEAENGGVRVCINRGGKSRH
jgi:hypothetical protein